jgi:mannose-1-phosphate guanylyltransferase
LIANSKSHDREAAMSFEKIKAAMILTAGLGTRLRPVTDLYAKPAIPFLNIPLLYYPTHFAELMGIRSLVLNTHYKPEQIQTLAREIDRMGFQTTCSHEPGTPLGSGGGIWQAREHLKHGDFLVANGDEVILPRDPRILEKFASEHFEKKALASILVMHHPLVGTQFGGVWADSQGGVKGFGKDAKQFPGTNGFHYIGLLLLSPRIFEYLPAGQSNILYDALAAAIAKGETVRAIDGDFTWFETGNPHDYLHATGEALQLLHNGKGYDAETLRQITLRHWPVGTKVDEKNGALFLTDKTSFIDSSAETEGFLVMGPSTRVGAGAKIKNSVLMANASVVAGAEACDTIVLTS